MIEKDAKNRYRYKDFILDDFQVRSIESLEKNNSVMVSAATGTGKTLIADYVVNKFANTDRRIIYTAPIKALSNQKYKEFHEFYGDDVGMMTGDIVINPDAKLLIMTTEIYRNMLLTRDSSVEDVSYVIFDEIHYINDIERGTVWEESIIFSPDNVRFLCLSATVPNAHEFADWISSIKEHKVDVIKYEKRAVPLVHYVYDAEAGMITAKGYKELAEIDKYNNVSKRRKKNKKKEKRPTAKHYHLIKELDDKQLLPCIFFTFSRKACEEKALELRKDFTNDKEKARIIEVMNKHIDREHNKMASVRTIKQVLPKGIGVHHAGIMPSVKSAVEELFNEGLIKVLYATETFAVGINMPARSVAFASLEKYDGISFRYLNSKEYFQMAGRAGRRGIDKEGTAVAMIDKQYADPDKIIRLTGKDTDPIKSQYKLSYNSVLNLLHNYDDSKTIEKILKSSFDYYLRKKAKKNIRIMGSFNNYLRRLRKFGYVDENNELTDKGDFARFIYNDELLITEIFYGNMVNELKPQQILAVLAAIIYEPRRNDKFSKIKMKKEYDQIISVIKENDFVDKKIDRLTLRKLMPIIYQWSEGIEFTELMEMTNLHEGDIIRVIRQIVDFMRQIIRASRDNRKIDKFQVCIDMIWRDVVVPGF
ncbi:MAG: DEAD/DEAH box helicase [Candidatus Woesearchaeota archaeon]